MSKTKRQQLQQALEKTFDKVIGFTDEYSAETIEVSDRYVVYVELASRPFKETGEIWFGKGLSLRCDWVDLRDNPTMFLKQVLPQIRKKDQVLAYWLGFTAIQDYC